MTGSYTIKDVTKDLGSLLALTQIYGVDNQGFWIDNDTKKRYVYKLDGNDQGKEVVLYQDPMPNGDFYFFNPFAEGLGRKSPASKNFYNIIRVTAGQKIVMAMEIVLQMVLASKEDPKLSLDPAILRMSSVPISAKKTFFDVVDDAMIKEFDTIFGRLPDGLIHVPYKSVVMTTEVTCPALTDPTWDEKFGRDIRKKSLEAFKVLLMGVLGLKQPEDIKKFSEKYDTSTKSAAELHTKIQVYINLYNAFNDVLPEPAQVDLGMIQDVVDRFPLAYAIAKHMIQPTVPKQSPLSIAPSNTSTFASPTFGNKSRFAPPEIKDAFGNRITPAAPIAPPVAVPGGPSRFHSPIVPMQPVDPFAPAVRQASPMFGAPAGAPVGFGVQAAYPAPAPQAGFTYGLPTNWGTPQTQQRYF